MYICQNHNTLRNYYCYPEHLEEDTPTIFGIKHLDFWFYLIYAFLKVVIIQISQNYLFLWNFPLWRISTFWGFVLNWNENKFQNLKIVCETQFPFSGQLKFQARTCIIAPLQGIPSGKKVSEWIQWCKHTIFKICLFFQVGSSTTENFPKSLHEKPAHIPEKPISERHC